MSLSSVALRSWIPPRSNSIAVMAAVDPGTNTETAPSSMPDWATTASTWPVRSIVSPSPSVVSVRSRLYVVKERAQPRGLVRRHRVPVLGLGVAPLAHVGGERRDAVDHRLANVAVALHEPRGVAVVDAEQIVEDQHLPVRVRACPDADDRDLELGYDDLG